MSQTKRFGIFLFVFLMLISIIHDLNQSSTMETESNSSVVNENIIEIAHLKVLPGDTVLSITEEINHIENLNIDKIKKDFTRLNPGVEINALTPHSFYYFPLYKDAS